MELNLNEISVYEVELRAEFIKPYDMRSTIPVDAVPEVITWLDKNVGPDMWAIRNFFITTTQSLNGRTLISGYPAIGIKVMLMDQKHAMMFKLIYG